MHIVVVVTLFLAAVLVNMVVLPGAHLVSSLFALPVLVMSRWGSNRVILLVAGVAVGLYVGVAIVKGREPLVVPFGILGIVVVSSLATWLAHERRRTVQERERLQRFMALVAHDMKQPLTILNGQLQLLARRSRRENGVIPVDALTPLNDATEQMGRLLDDLQDASAIGSGQFRIDPAEIDLVDVLASVLEHHRVLETGHCLTLDGESSLVGRWDAVRLRQLFTNLITNAIKYTPPGGEVRVSVSRRGNNALVRVTDQGPGISLAQQEQMFMPFSRLETSAGTKGMGLGLYISKGIVSAHHGSISISSEMGAGATFDVLLPLDPAYA